MNPVLYRALFFTGLAALFSSPVLAAVLSGNILEKGTQAPVLGASLYWEPLDSPTPLAPPAAVTGTEPPASTPGASPTMTPVSFSADTDLKGKYQIAVPEGLYRLTIAGEGFQKVVLSPFTVDQDSKKDFFLVREGFTLPEVVVSTAKGAQSSVSHEALSKDELKSVPGTAGDVLRALQSLPGVAVAGDFSGQLIVRGGGPQDNLYLMDRIPLAFPFHFGGLISTVNSDLIQNVDFSAGGFGAQYGNYWGGVVDITERNARQDRWGGRAEVNMLLSEGLVEGPVTSDSSIALAGRRSYLELLGGGFFNDFTAIPSFGDYQTKYNWEESRDTHWDFQAFGSDDRVGAVIKPDNPAAQKDPALAGDFEFHNGYDSQGVNYRRLFGGADTLLATLYHTNFFFDTHLGRDLHLDINFEDFGGHFDWLHDFKDDSQLKVGLEVDHTITGNNSYFVELPGEGQPSFDLSTAEKISASETTFADNIGTYVEEKFKGWDRLELTAGLRADFLAYNSHFTWGPRLSASYLLFPDTTLKASYGTYFQLPWQGPYLDPSFGNPHLLSEKAVSSILGVEQKLSDGLYFRVEGYNKDLTDVVVPDPALHYNNTGTGYSRGVEFFLRRPPTERFFGWISYAFSDSVRHNAPGDTHVYDYDQPNIATVVASYKINPGWEVGLKWRYSSGLPDTPITGSTYSPVTIDGLVYSRYSAIYGPVNSSRLPDYQRLDLSTSFATVYNTWQWRFYIEILNVLNHPNVFAYDYNEDYSSKTAINQIPFLPYIGFEAKY